ncbi:hypothetical protein CYMTET_47839 [Cymbomonas tetramitiformis]|nr:hypothetical protein CYMTET_47839 [Cymbomonas tetramitiformis]
MWLPKLLPEGWTLRYVNGHKKKSKAVNEETGVANDYAPEGTLSVLELFVNPAMIGPATHFVSFPALMLLTEIVEAVESTLSASEQPVFIWMDVLSIGWNDNVHIQQAVINETRQVVQVCSKWDDPERLKRAWMMFELFSAIRVDAELHYAMTLAEQRRLADDLRINGPNVVLDIVYRFEADPCRTHSMFQLELLKTELHSIVEQQGGRAEIEHQLAERTRSAYAKIIAREFDRRWAELGDMDLDGGITKSESDVLDLGHQLARLWALTQNVDLAEKLFGQVLQRLPSAATTVRAGAHARRDRTTAELVQLLKQQGRIEDAHTAERDVSGCGKLPVSWEGISVSYLEGFAEENAAELRFLSTDAFVERVVKPETRKHGAVALIETAACNEARGKPTFFVSHAWRQTFYVPKDAPAAAWRGGLVQALVGSTSKEARGSTHFWYDVFCVNQHLRSPYDGGLLAFAFDPLRNAIIECDHLKLFMETWDDPAPLSRVWCLVEIHAAFLLGKEVKIVMPPRAMDTFRKQGTKDDIERIVSRIDIKHASATFQSDRHKVLNFVEDTIGCDNLTLFCQEIIRAALYGLAGMAKSTDRSKWTSLLKGIVDTVENQPCSPGTVPKEIEVKRGVAMMQCRIFPPDAIEHIAGKELLNEVAHKALRFYGPRSQLYLDLKRQTDELGCESAAKGAKRRKVTPS